MTRPAEMPLRTLVVALLLTGFGLWQAWNCTDGMMASPVAATTMTATMHPTAAALTHAVTAGDQTMPVQAVPDEPDPGMPAGMAGLCVTVLASFAAALILTFSPLKLLGLLRRLGHLLVRPIEFPGQGPVLARLCISRT